MISHRFSSGKAGVGREIGRDGAIVITDFLTGTILLLKIKSMWFISEPKGCEHKIWKLKTLESLFCYSCVGNSCCYANHPHIYMSRPHNSQFIILYLDVWDISTLAFIKLVIVFLENLLLSYSLAYSRDRKQLFLLLSFSSHPQFLSILPLKSLLLSSSAFCLHWYVHIVQAIVISCLCYCYNFLTGLSLSDIAYSQSTHQ